MNGWMTYCLCLSPYQMFFLLGCNQKLEQDFSLCHTFAICNPLHQFLIPSIDVQLFHQQRCSLCTASWPTGQIQVSQIQFVTHSNTRGLAAAWLHVPLPSDSKTACLTLACVGFCCTGRHLGADGVLSTVGNATPEVCLCVISAKINL